MREHSDPLTVVGIAALAASLNVAFHESVHALSAVLVGARLREYSALYIDSAAAAPWQERVIAGSASIANLVAGIVLWLVLRRVKGSRPRLLWFLWLLMLMSLLYGAGYWMFSGAAGVGDWATVVEGWEAADLLRIIMFVVGSILFLFFVWLALRLFGRIAGGSAVAIRRYQVMATLSYAASACVIALAGVFNPHGFLSLPVTAGLAASLGALSPLLWMMQWLRSRIFPKVSADLPPIGRSWGVVVGAAAIVFCFCFLLGRTLYFPA